VAAQVAADAAHGLARCVEMCMNNGARETQAALSQTLARSQFNAEPHFRHALKHMHAARPIEAASAERD
jgi:hypothetical protein